MPKGKRGCFQCGAQTARVVQVTLRDVDWKAPTSREKIVDSVLRSFCKEHGEQTYKVIARILQRRHDRGCGACGHTPTTSRIQIWTRQIGDIDPRTGYRPQTSIPGLPSTNTSYCEACHEAIYDAATGPLDGGNWNMRGGGSRHGGDMAAARAARGRKKGK